MHCVRCGKSATLRCPKCVERGIPSDRSSFCGQDCFKQSWKDHRQLEHGTPSSSTNLSTSAALDHHFKIQAVKGKGLGVLATRQICLGERLLAEPPLFCLDANATVEAANDATKKLSDGEKELVFSLYQSDEVYGKQVGLPQTILSIHTIRCVVDTGFDVFLSY